MDLSEIALTIISNAPSSTFISIGYYQAVSVDVLVEAQSISFQSNVGGMKRPSKEEAKGLFEKLAQLHTELLSLPDYSKFVADKSFSAVLYVFSGQMDFRVATFDGKQIQWEVELE
jgi:hypothetical protein